MNTNTFAIGIPTLNRMDLLEPALRIYAQNFPNTEIYVVDNGNQEHPAQSPKLKYITPEKNLGVAASWNVLLKKIFWERKKAAALILNDDIVYSRTEAEVVEYINKKRANFIVALQDWCCFICKQETFARVGLFDENFFPAYYEDTDYERRMKLSGIGFIRDNFLQPSVYRDNSTGAMDPTVYRPECKEYYRKKWGGIPGAEKFSTPFNEVKKK